MATLGYRVTRAFREKNKPRKKKKRISEVCCREEWNKSPNRTKERENSSSHCEICETRRRLHYCFNIAINSSASIPDVSTAYLVSCENQRLASWSRSQWFFTQYRNYAVVVIYLRSQLASSSVGYISWRDCYFHAVWINCSKNNYPWLAG